MQFNGDVNGQDIVTQTRWYCDADANAFSVNDITRNANIAYHMAIVAIQKADGTWQYDDSTNTTLPIATTDLVINQKTYTLADTHLEIERVDMKDPNGNWVKLMPYDQSQIDQSIDWINSVSAIPRMYDKSGSVLALTPPSSYNSTAGLKVYFKRHANIFVVGDTTKKPGFAEAFHNYIPLYTAITYCNVFKPTRVAALQADLDKLEKKMVRFYARREKDVGHRLSARTINAT
jgi:hypothetical protein